LADLPKGDIDEAVQDAAAIVEAVDTLRRAGLMRPMVAHIARGAPIADDERAAAGQLSGEPAQPVDRARADDEPGAGPDLEIARAVAVHHAAPTGLAAATCNARER